MTAGGPFFATDVAATFVYRTAYTSSNGIPRLGYASAAAVTFGLLVVFIGIIGNSFKSMLNSKKVM
jgi:multiple sugar transport system permease protein